MEDNNLNYYVLSGLISLVLEEITHFDRDQFCFTTNGFQFESIKELVLNCIDAIALENEANWTFLLEGMLKKLENLHKYYTIF